MEYNAKNILGKLLFVVSILFLGYMIFSPLTKTIIHIDEFWTMGVINLPLIESIPLMVSDVHPPLYYLALKIIFKIFGVSYNNIFLLKLVSILPYIIILFVFGRKMKNEYNWLTIGLFTFILATLNMFFIQFHTIRMYNWGLLFLLMSFIYFKYIIEDSNKKAWVLFTIFSVLVAYTHYFILITTVLLYIILLIYFSLDINKNLVFKEELKKWIISVVSSILLYLPWLFTFLNQINHRQHIHNPSFPKILDMVNYFTYYAGIESNFSFETLLFKIFAFVALILIGYIFIKECKSDSDNIENFYVGVGLGSFFLTLIFGVIISSLAFNIFSMRYLVPVAGLFWFSVSILIGRINNNKLLIISLILITIFSVIGFNQTIDFTSSITNNNETTIDLLNSLNNENNVIIYTQEFHYINFHKYLSNTIEYKSEFYMPYKPRNINEIKSINEIYDKKFNKDIYIIKAINFKTDDDFDNINVDNITYEKYGNYSNIWFIHVKN